MVGACQKEPDGEQVQQISNIGILCHIKTFLEENRMMKKTFLLIFVGLFFIAGCASFGVWGGTDRINEKEFIVSVSIPPISGGGTFANAYRSALDVAKSNVKKWGYKYFVLVDGSTSESHKFFAQANINSRGGNYTAQTFTNTNGQFYFYILEDSQLEEAREAGLSIIDAYY